MSAPTAVELFPPSECRDGQFIGAAEAARIGAKLADPVSVLRALPESPAPEALEEALRQFAELLGPDPLRRAAHRGAAIEALKARKATGPAAVVDAALGTPAAADAMPGSGTALKLPEPEPWPVPVDGARLLTDMAAVVRRHVILTAEQADAVALWVMFTHAIDGARIAPKLAITSPTLGCGKSTLQDVLELLVPRPLRAASISPAAVYRTIETAHPTLLIDEGDAFLGNNDELRGILDAGHTRGAGVVRCVGEDSEPRWFTTWCAQAICAIDKLPATVASRSIEIRLKRKRKGEAVAKLNRLAGEGLAMLGRQAARWAQDNPIADANPAMPDGMGNRAADNWEPLLAIADLAGGDWPELARKAAVALSGGEPEDGQAVGVRLLADIRTVFDGDDLAEPEADSPRLAQPVERIASEDLAKRLGAMESHPWAEWGRAQKPISAPQLARQLRHFGISPRVIRLATGTPRGYSAADFVDAWARYYPEKTSPPPENTLSKCNSATTRINTGQSANFASATETKCCGSKNAVSPNKDAGCCTVAVSNPESGGEGGKPAAQGEMFDGAGMGHWDL